MNAKLLPRSIATLVLFFLINFGLWEVMVYLGMPNAWASFTVYFVLFIVVLLIWKNRIPDYWSDFNTETTNWKKFFLTAIVWLVIAIALSYLLQFLASGNSQTSNTENVGSMADTIPPILTCIMLTILGPFIEEFTFRESLIGFVDKDNKILLTIMTILSIIIFDCIHLYNWREFFYYLPLSIALTMFYRSHNRNIFSSIIMHSMANLPGAILMITGMM
ncbi:CPBP family intramembrane metalloprotease [Enterococcus sp. 669A]|uniref:CPBP family intramembrane metalloprotease n=1 Tax=Candidatus Enterococcus moelleringii TaxID=2815325 RepID=A0ABS3LFZ6_9ENTE|nr:CPBP family intramembrane glutamic endopeptidase [Enterococcus sp. 669A]MBO1308571.1 CPBP family intramembrane metalloprotease [Enterococcus sp. 669A]